MENTFATGGYLELTVHFNNMTQHIDKPKPGTYAPYFDTYISRVKGESIFEELSTAYIETMELVTSLDAETLHSRYAEGKWTILQILQHIIDTERIFNYRALSVARGDQNPLPGFDEQAYAANAQTRNVNDLVRELSLVRASTIELFKSFTPEQLDQVGTANKNPITARALLYMTLGHELHHRHIIETRYL